MYKTAWVMFAVIALVASALAAGMVVGAHQRNSRPHSGQQQVQVGDEAVIHWS